MGNTAFKIIVLPIAISIILIVFMRDKPDKAEVKTISIGDARLQVEIADTSILRAKGLSNRESLGENSGMLFIYKDKRQRNFWMKDMHIPLDVLWIADGVVVGIQENIPFESSDADIVRFESKKEVNWVLEVNAGWISKNNVATGGTVDIVKN